MTMREMIIERILWAVTEYTLATRYHVTEEGLAELSDADLLDLYEDVAVDGVQ